MSNVRVFDEAPSQPIPEELASSDLSYLSDIEEEARSEVFSLASSSTGSSVLGSSQLSASGSPSVQSNASSDLTDTGFVSLNWRAEMTPGAVSLFS